MRMRIQQISLMLLVLLMAVAPAYAQSVTVTGKITDAETGQLLEGVTVTVKGGRSTVTDEKGIFSLNVLSLKEASLICSYIGYINQSIRLNGRSNVNVQLFPAKSELETVVVSGYAKAKRREEVVGAITTVTAKDLLADRPIESFDKMLEGLAAGVQVQTNTELGTPVKSISVGKIHLLLW
jgi:TonB-dependent starch-binding outer membrane protein SusC